MAAAPDFTKTMQAELSPGQREALARTGVLRIPNHYCDEPYTITQDLLREGAQPEWTSVHIPESWFPDAFIGSMANLLCFAEGSSHELINHVDSAFQTMQVVEAAYLSSDSGGTVI